MKKVFLNKIVIGAIIASTMTVLTPLGVSAATNSGYNLNSNIILNTNWVSNDGTWYCYDKAGDAKTGWINYNGRWYYCDSTGAMQTGVINVNGKTYCLNTSGAMVTGKVTVNNKTYTSSSNGQVTGTKIPTYDKQFNSDNSIINDKNKTSTVSNSNSSKPSTDTGITKNTGSTTNNTATAENTTTTNKVSTDVNNVDVQGLPQLPTTYSINVQPTAEEKILELMNEKRVQAGLQPLTLDNTLVQVSRYKSNHMIQYNYFNHITPEGTKWTNWLQTLGYKYTTTGENIAYNTSDPVELFNQWWNSPGHRANMMNSSYTKVGIGVVLGNNKYMGTQQFSN